MQNIDGFDNLASSIGVEETSLEDQSSNRCSSPEGTKMSHARSFTKTSNYDYHRRKAMSIILVISELCVQSGCSSDLLMTDRQAGREGGLSISGRQSDPCDVGREKHRHNILVKPTNQLHTVYYILQLTQCLRFGGKKHREIYRLAVNQGTFQKVK